jgi:Ni,Fe-hydrogenase maturation factor
MYAGKIVVMGIGSILRKEGGVGVKVLSNEDSWLAASRET